eukprot:gene4311-4360_t
MTYATMLVNIESGNPNAHLLEFAGIFAARFESRVLGATACTPIQMLYADGYIDGEIFEQDRQEIDKEMAAARTDFKASFGDRIPEGGWRSATTFLPLADCLAAEARRADIVLTAAPSDDEVNTARQINLGEFVLQAGRPVLLVAAKSSASFAKVVVAWKDTREARRAIMDALPILKRAGAVTIVEVAPKDELAAAGARLADVAAWLQAHHVTAEFVPLASDGEDADRLERFIREFGADLVVAGAYGHSRVREWALGGVTRSLLRNLSRAVLLSH